MLVLLALPPVDDAQAQSARFLADERQRCWSAPTPATVEEALAVAANSSAEERARLASGIGNEGDVLLMSGGALKTAYAAGLLVGWGETGRRPRFAAVTAAEMSALIAPFAFIGPAGDQAIADIFNCSATDLTEMAARAASYLDGEVLEAIAREHEGGRRLFIALLGSAARPETVWDLGRLAASRHHGVAALARQVLRAAVDHHTFVDPSDAPAGVGKVVARNFAFRVPGAGAQFLLPPEVAQLSAGGARHHLIHNGVIFADESADFILARASSDDLQPRAREIVPAYDIVRHARAANGGFRFAAIKPRLGLVPQAPFDMPYVRALFLYAYRQGRMGKEWQSSFPGLPQGPAEQSR